MATRWVLVGNASEASIYNFLPAEKKTDQPKLELVEKYEHPESRERDLELVTDKPGNYRGGMGGHGDFVEASRPKKHEAEVFAIQLANVLEEGRVLERYKALTIVATPFFLGLLKQHLNSNVSHLVTDEILKDYTKEQAKDLLLYLQQFSENFK